MVHVHAAGQDMLPLPLLLLHYYLSWPETIVPDEPVLLVVCCAKMRMLARACRASYHGKDSRVHLHRGLALSFGIGAYACLLHLLHIIYRTSICRLSTAGYRQRLA